jgi:hypothetical protein
VVDPCPVLELDQPAPAAEVAGHLDLIGRDRDAAGVVGMEHGEADSRRLEAAALVHPHRLDPTAGEVDAGLVGADDRAATGGELNDVGGVVADVVEVQVSRGDDVHLPRLRRRDVGRCATPSVHPDPLVSRRAIQDPAVAQAGDAQLRHRDLLSGAS